MTQSLAMRTLPTHYRSGDELERGVLSELKGKANEKSFRASLRWYEKTLIEADQVALRLDELLALAKNSKQNPEFEAALSKILIDHPEVERVSLKGSRYSNLGEGRIVGRHTGPIGKDLVGVLEGLRIDLDLVRENLRATIREFKNVLPTARSGGMAALILSGRASFPELVMQGEDIMSIFVRYYGQACMTTIAATMLVYPKGLEGLPQPDRR